MPYETAQPEEVAGLAQFLGFDPSPLGLFGFALAFLYAMLRGHVQPRSSVERMLAVKDAEIASRDAELERARLTIVALEARGDIQDEAVRKFMAQQASTQHLIEEFHLSLMRASGTPVPPDYPHPSPIDSPGGSS
ncbi:hypothetical protein [Kineococcus radiotolerans]|uniref:hypothetical protein n=1 Tax=Kineococcus radiotolerans TaxID=131568 RepID=UPI00003A415E|nr:hypothetical protein [Kineococcus radiotolerans]